MSAGSPQHRCEVFYQGRVQGVGFRYTVVRIAQRYEVTGYVKNLPDGRVQLVAEGSTEELRQLVEDVAEAMEGYIQQFHEESTAASGEFSRFEVRH